MRQRYVSNSTVTSMRELSKKNSSKTLLGEELVEPLASILRTSVLLITAGKLTKELVEEEVAA